VLGESLRKSAAAFDGQGQIGDDLSQQGILFLPFQHPQPAQQRQPGVHQRRQLARKSRQDLRLYFPAEPGDSDDKIEPALFLAFGVAR